MSNNALAFYLDAPLQAWGASSRFQRRETEAFPTKSGIIGLIAAAMGIDKHSRDEPEQLRSLGALKFSVLRVEKKSGAVQRLSDFHTIGGGWYDDWKQDKDNLVAKMHTPRKAGDGSPFGTVITHRTYLTDAKFIAVLEGEKDVVERVAAALENPKWGVWFGRKCCLPAAPLLPVVASSPTEAIHALVIRFGLDDMNPTAAQGQEESDGDGAWFPSDQPISFGKREYQARPVRRKLSG
jgi:CRISPR system Cascade subunit CasD